jgi:hypothetical protein
MSKGRQLSFLPETPDEDGDQLDLIEEAGTEVLSVDLIRPPTIQQAIEASWALPNREVDEILGDGGLSGATTGQLAELVRRAGLR